MTAPSPASRYAAALSALGRTASSLAPAFGCSPGLTRKWARTGPPPDVLDYVETLAAFTAALPVPVLRETRGGRRHPAIR